MGRCGSAAQMQMMGRSIFKEEGLGFLNSPHSRAAGTRNYVQQAFSTYANVQPPIISDTFLPPPFPQPP
jgi:hypothetical protein